MKTRFLLFFYTIDLRYSSRFDLTTKEKLINPTRSRGAGLVVGLLGGHGEASP